MQYIFYILLVHFLYFNYKIVISDLKNKIIPNKYLSYLLILVPIYYIYIFISFPEINYFIFIGQIFLTLFISFILYYFGIWAAGDAKYLLVLSLFIPHIGIIPFIGNIALITLAYLFGYFIWFYFGKCIIYKGYAKILLKQILNDLSGKWEVYKKNTFSKYSTSKGKELATFFIILKWLVVFLIIFVSIRLSRIYLFNSMLKNENNFDLLKNFIEKYNIYLVFLLIGIFIGGLYLFKISINKLKLFIGNKLKLNINLVGNIFIFILFIILISFIIWEYHIHKTEITNLLFRVFTLYLGIYLIFKILIYSYKITFGIAEMDYIDIKNLKQGDIVDKKYLVNLFGNQIPLGFEKYPEKNYKNKNLLLFPSPKNYFLSMNNFLDQDELIIIKKCYNIVNKYHKKNKTEGYNNINNIKILNTFSFAPYLIVGFIIVFIFENKIFKYILNIITNIVKSFY